MIDSKGGGLYVQNRPPYSSVGTYRSTFRVALYVQLYTLWGPFPSLCTGASKKANVHTYETDLFTFYTIQVNLEKVITVPCSRSLLW